MRTSSRAGPEALVVASEGICIVLASPAIVRERYAGIYIGTQFPQEPNPNPNDRWLNEFVIPTTGSRRGFDVLWRNRMTRKLLAELSMNPIGVPNFVRPEILFFVHYRYESVQGLSDEVGILWEYNFGAAQWVQEPETFEKYPNYTYRRLGVSPGAVADRKPRWFVTLFGARTQTP